MKPIITLPAVWGMLSPVNVAFVSAQVAACAHSIALSNPDHAHKLGTGLLLLTSAGVMNNLSGDCHGWCPADDVRTRKCKNAPELVQGPHLHDGHGDAAQNEQRLAAKPAQPNAGQMRLPQALIRHAVLQQLSLACSARYCPVALWG